MRMEDKDEEWKGEDVFVSPWSFLPMHAGMQCGCIARLSLAPSFSAVATTKQSRTNVRCALVHGTHINFSPVSSLWTGKGQRRVHLFFPPSLPPSCSCPLPQCSALASLPLPQIRRRDNHPLERKILFISPSALVLLYSSPSVHGSGWCLTWNVLSVLRLFGSSDHGSLCLVSAKKTVPTTIALAKWAGDSLLWWRTVALGSLNVEHVNR